MLLTSQANTGAALESSKTYTDTANTWLRANDYTTLTTSKSYTDTANTWLRANDYTTLTTSKSYTDTANTWLQANTNAVRTFAVASYTRANTSANSFSGTSGSAIPSNGVVTFNSGNGITVTGSGNTLTVNTAQDIRTTASPTFNSLTLTNALGINQGGTGATSASQALTNLLPTGTTAGYVLTTGGPGTFYWAAQTGSGGGVTPGTSINSTRIYTTATSGQKVFTTPTYTPGASQLSVYINGVKQYNSEYNETSNVSVTLTNGATTGDVVLLEVNGYFNNPYYANNITFTAPFGGITSSANTIQLAIQDLETRKATLAGPAFTGIATSVTPSTNTSNTQIATTAFVKNTLNSGNTFAINISGNATTANYANTANNAATATGQAVGITSNVQFKAIGVGVSPESNTNTGDIVATGTITAYYSDDRLKTKLGNIENALEKVLSLNGFYYQPNAVAQELGYTVKTEVGVSAQEVEKVLPEVVVPAPVDNKYLTVHYERIIPLLIESIKELKSEIEELKGNNK